MLAQLAAGRLLTYSPQPVPLLVGESVSLCASADFHVPKNTGVLLATNVEMMIEGCSRGVSASIFIETHLKDYCCDGEISWWPVNEWTNIQVPIAAPMHYELWIEAGLKLADLYFTGRRGELVTPLFRIS